MSSLSQVFSCVSTFVCRSVSPLRLPATHVPPALLSDGDDGVSITSFLHLVKVKKFRSVGAVHWGQLVNIVPAGEVFSQ